MFTEYSSISCIHALSSILKFCSGRTDVYVKIMQLVAPTSQLMLRLTDLSWSVGDECGDSSSYKYLKTKSSGQQILPIILHVLSIILNSNKLILFVVLHDERFCSADLFEDSLKDLYVICQLQQGFSWYWLEAKVLAIHLNKRDTILS